MKAKSKVNLWRYAPIWAILFAAGATIAKSMGTHYILKRQVEFKWTDLATALGGAVFGYFTFRARHGEVDKRHWYTR